MEPDSLAIQTKDLTKRFGTFTAVDQVNFEVRRGEVFGLLGPNGAGKTTVVRMLTTLLVPSGGHATGRRLRRRKAPAPGAREHRRHPAGAYLRPRSHRMGERRYLRRVLRPLAPRAPRTRPAPAPHGRADRARQRSRRDLLGRHAPPARNRARPDSLAQDTVPRRADDRAGPAKPTRRVGFARDAAQGKRDYHLAHDALHGRSGIAVRPDRDRRRRQDNRAGHADWTQGDGAGRATGSTWWSKKIPPLSPRCSSRCPICGK